MVLICKTCLASNVKMFTFSSKLSIGDISISEAYLDLTGIPDFTAQDLVCFECAHMLCKFVIYKRNCLEANEILKTQLTSEDTITTRRKEHRLGLTLGLLPAMPMNIDPEISYEIHSVDVDDFKKENLETTADSIISENELPLTDGIPLFPYIYVKKPEAMNNRNKHDSDNEKQCTPPLSPNISISDDDVPEVIVDTIKEKEEPPSRKRKQATVPKNIIWKQLTIKDNVPLLTDCEVINSNNEKSKTVKRKVKQDKSNKEKKLKFDSSYFDGFAKAVILTDEEAKKEFEARKERNSYLIQPYKCDLCYKGFHIKKAYEEHKARHSPEAGPYVCEFCHLRYKSDMKLKNHQNIYHRWKFCCTLCPYVSHRKFQARHHMAVHQGLKSRCDICNIEFSDPNYLLKHKRLKHDTMSVCEICGSTFPTVKGLSTHTALVHSQEKNERKGPKCDVCNAHFSNDMAWERHLVLSSKHAVSNGCKICGATFRDPESLRAHSKKHLKFTKSIPDICDICDTWLETKEDYIEHMRSQHPNSAAAAEGSKLAESLLYVCEFCGKGFKRHTPMLYHKRKHTGERPYVCKVCGKTFAYPSAFWTHKLKHNKNRPKPSRVYKCELCDRNMSSSGALAKHIKVHHLKLRPHKCNLCGKAFANPCEVKYHTQYVHNKMPWPKRDRSKRNKAVAEQADKS